MTWIFQGLDILYLALDILLESSILYHNVILLGHHALLLILDWVIFATIAGKLSNYIQILHFRSIIGFI